MAHRISEESTTTDIINNGIVKGDMAYIRETGIMMIVVSIGSMLFAIAGSYTAALIAAKTSKNIREALFKKVTNFSAAELEEFSNLSSDVKNAGSDLNSSTLCIDGLDCSPLVEDVATLITTQYTSMLGNLDQIIAAAENVYNSKQDEYNQIARYRDQQEANRRAAMRASSN